MVIRLPKLPFAFLGQQSFGSSVCVGSSELVMVYVVRG